MQFSEKIFQVYCKKYSRMKNLLYLVGRLDVRIWWLKKYITIFHNIFYSIS